MNDESVRRRFTKDELGKVLQEHRKWLESDGKEGAQADFTWADLTEAGFSNANLKRAKFSKAHLNRANFRNADLQGAVFRSAFMKGCNLKDANCHDADLSSTKLDDANLQRTALFWANLQDAKLREANNLLTGQLAGSNLSGAKLPREIAEFDALEYAAELSKNARKMFFAMLLGCAYTLLTVVTTDDVRLLTNSASSPLPIIGTEIPIVGFYIAAPIILLGIYIYFQLHVQRNWEVLATLPAFFPDGRPLDRKAYPWLLNGLVRVHSKLLKASRPSMTSLQSVISITLAWGAVPFTLLALWARFLTRHDWTVTWIHIVCLTIGFAYSILAYLVARRTLKGKYQNPFRWKSSLIDSRSYMSLVVTAIIAVFFYLGSYGAINGVPTDQGEGIRTYVPYLLSMVGCEPFANFLEKDVSFKPDNWTGDKAQFGIVKSPQLRYCDLRFLNGESAFLANADLRGTDLSHATLYKANLQYIQAGPSSVDTVYAYDSTGALDAHAIIDVFGTELSIVTKFKDANLMRAKLNHSNLLGADFSNANLFAANLDSVNLSNANLYSSKFIYANLSNANLNRATIIKADMRYCDLSNVTLLHTEIQSTDLRHAKGLTLNQINYAIIDSTTILPDYLIEELRADTTESFKELLRRLGLD